MHIKMELVRLPKETLNDILIKLPLIDLSQMCQLNTNIKHICDNDYFWEQKVITDNLLKYEIVRKPHESGREYYQRIHSMSEDAKSAALMRALFNKNWDQMMNKLKDDPRYN